MTKYLMCIVFFAACSGPAAEEQPVADSSTAMTEPAKPDSSDFASSVKAKGDYTFKVITTDNGFGYDIYSGEKLSIHQPIIPGLPGNNGFKTAAEAEKVAELVIHKLNNNIMPPSVTKEEMDSVLNQK